MKRCLTILLAFGALIFITACQGEKPGARCDKFFQNTCKAPMSCVAMSKGKFCAGSCDSKLVNSKFVKFCKDPKLAPSSVTYKKGTTTIGGAGCYCLPKAS